MKDASIPFCPYCKQPSVRVSGDVIYPHIKKLHDRYFYACLPCDAYVGTHVHSGKPLGRLANAALRHKKTAAHKAFDPIWAVHRHLPRKKAYAWLAGKIGVKPEWCHIGMFNEELCQKVIDASNQKVKEIMDKKAKKLRSAFKRD